MGGSESFKILNSKEDIARWTFKSIFTLFLTIETYISSVVFLICYFFFFMLCSKAL
jgi:heme/copper-type cytochrome/quinol oxidase subunit 2